MAAAVDRHLEGLEALKITQMLRYDTSGLRRSPLLISGQIGYSSHHISKMMLLLYYKIHNERRDALEARRISDIFLMLRLRDYLATIDHPSLTGFESRGLLRPVW